MTEATVKNKIRRITENISLVFGLAAFVISLFLLLSRVGVIESTIDKKTADRWRSSDMRNWAESLQRLNPELKVPPCVPGERRE